jgi:acyl-CoA reductase-like NAD-dependent aldehyde dehydrogenase
MTTVFRNFIAGEFVSPAKAAPNLNPSNTNEVVGEYAQGTVEDLMAAVAAAKEAFPAWSRSNPQLRYDVLMKASNEVMARKEELGAHALPRGGQDPARGYRRGHPRRPDPLLLRRRGTAPER